MKKAIVSSTIIGLMVIGCSLMPGNAGGGGGFGEMVAYLDLNDTVEDLAISGNYAYITAKTYGVHIVDISDPKNPALVTTWEDTKDQAWNVTVNGNYLYVADKKGGLAIVDISDPANPKEVGRYNVGYDVEEAAIDGNYAYLGGGTGTDGVLIVVDISDPTNPEEVVVDTIKGEALISITEADGWVYAGGGDGTLYIFDVSDPTSPEQKTTYYNEGNGDFEPWGLGVTVANNKLFYSDWGAGLIILDITDPANPEELSVFFDKNAFYDCYVVGDRAYAANSWGGFAVLDISDPTNPVLVGDSTILSDIEKTIEKPAIHGVWVKDNYAFLVDNGEQILSVIDVKE